MNPNDILELYRYNEWANERLVGAALLLPAESIHREFDGSFRTIRDLLAHIVSVDWVWLERWHGTSPTSIPDWVASDDVAALARRHRDTSAQRLAFIRGLDETSLAVKVSFRYISGAAGKESLGDLLFHVINHSTYHRGQLASMLRAVGSAPPATDFVVYKRESRA